jgi:F-type H+-transporting ATPase subunit gamma
MASLRELRRKGKSVESIRQITQAMKMVAAARLRRAQGRMLGARPFAADMERLLADVLRASDAVGNGAPSPTELSHPLLETRDEGARGLLLITADKGLCGAFNTNLVKKALEFLKENEGRRVVLFCVGRKGRDYFRRLVPPLGGEHVNLFNNLSFAHAEIIGKDVMDFFLRKDVRDVTIIYNEFKTILQQRLVRTTLLPLAPTSPLPTDSGAPGSRFGGNGFDFIYEPGKGELVEALFPRVLKSRIYRALLESYASELGARMAAMENATKNAEELIADLTLTANKIRQAAITKEISELVGGSEVLR